MTSQNTVQIYSCLRFRCKVKDMCNRYTPPALADIEREWAIGRQNPPRWWDAVLYPRGTGPFLRRARDDAGYSRELVVGQWGLIPWFAKAPKLKHPLNNARSEEMAGKASFKLAWARGQRCIIPAADFDEPYWGPYDAPYKRCEWWRFRRADGRPWALAGLWNTWTDDATGEVHESYTMLTINADGHPLMGRMHKSELDPKTKEPLPLEQQDKRSVIPIEPADYDQWLAGTQQEAAALLRLAPVETFNAGPAS